MYKVSLKVCIILILVKVLATSLRPLVIWPFLWCPNWFDFLRNYICQLSTFDHNGQSVHQQSLPLVSSRTVPNTNICGFFSVRLTSIA